MSELHGKSYRVLTPEMWDSYGTALPTPPTLAEKALLALSQVLIGDRHYGAKLHDDRARECVEMAYEAAWRLCEAEGSPITSRDG